MYSFTQLYNIFYLFFCIIWPPLQMYYLGVDGAGRTILALSIPALLCNVLSLGHQKNILRSPAFICWIILVAFSIVNSLMKGYSAESGSLAFFKTNYIAPFVFFYVLILELERDYTNCLRVLFYALLTYIFLCLGSMSLDDDERIVAEGLKNLLPLHSTCLVFVGGLLYRNRNLSAVLFYFIVLLAIVVTMLSGTRKALGAIIILLTGIIINNGDNEKRSIGYYARLIFFFVILYWGVGFIMDNTMIGSRLAGTAEQSTVELVGNKKINMVLNTILGDRAIQYELGYLTFLKHPWTGIGLTNFMSVTGYPYRLHTEYMTQLCENGIIGFLLLMLFYFHLIRKLLVNYKKYGDDITIVLFGLLAILFINITAWTYCTIFGMIYYAIILSHAYSNDDDVEDEEFDDEEGNEEERTIPLM